MADDSTLTTRQRRAIHQLLEQRTVRAAAEAAGVAERTLHRWLTEPAFRLALAAAENELLDAATRRLLALQDDAIGVFESLLADGESSTVKLRAASATLDYLLKLREMRDIEQRLAALEQSIATQKGR